MRQSPRYEGRGFSLREIDRRYVVDMAGDRETEGRTVLIGLAPLFVATFLVWLFDIHSTWVAIGLGATIFIAPNAFSPLMSPPSLRRPYDPPAHYPLPRMCAVPPSIPRGKRNG